MKCDLWLAANWTLVHGQCLHPVCSLNGSDALDGSRDVHYGWFPVSLAVKAQMGRSHPSHSPLFGPSGKELTKPVTSAKPHIMSLSVSSFGLSSPLDSINWGPRQLFGMVLEANTKKKKKNEELVFQSFSSCSPSPSSWLASHSHPLTILRGHLSRSWQNLASFIDIVPVHEEIWNNTAVFCKTTSQSSEI